MRVAKPETTLQPLLITVEDAAKLLCLGRTTIYQLIERENLPVHRFNSAVRINPDELEKWLRERQIE